MATPTRKPSEPQRQRYNAYVKYSAIAFQMLTAILLFTWSGVELDKWLETAPAFTATLSLIGVIAGIYLAIKDFIKK